MECSSRAVPPRKAQGRLQIPGTRISSRRVAPQVLWPLHRFTAKFEMDWSGSSAASAPRNCYVLFCLRFWLSSMSIVINVIDVQEPQTQHLSLIDLNFVVNRVSHKRSWACCYSLCCIKQHLIRGLQQTIIAPSWERGTRSNSVGLLVCLSYNHCWPYTWHLSNSLSGCDL